ncbi:HK97 family phage prohead protease [Actinotalea sp. JY-7876]|uniref:HK97 family phage prohead protease n=1 Tax=Actinotalea sp. JY-7876 TaxID=2758442 RepID=UPI0015F508B7|nr:HK97 family phage prohead protease [Actinotalea sp. JY-7876]
MDTELVEQIAAAGRERSQAVAQRADRPGQRRCAPEQSARAWVSAPAERLELRAADAEGGSLRFEGYAAVYERGYEMWDWYGPYTEVVSAGAGASSLARADLDVPLVLQHSALRRIARTSNGTLLLSEDETGLRTDAPALDPTDADVAYIAPKLRAGLIDEMSFMFRIVRGIWSPDYTEYRIEEYDIHRGDVAIVAYGANPFTVGAGLRSSDALEVVRSLDEQTAREAFTVLRSRLEPAGALPQRGRDLVSLEDTRLVELV